MQGAGYGVWGAGCGVRGAGYGVWGAGCGVRGAGHSRATNDALCANHDASVHTVDANASPGSPRVDSARRWAQQLVRCRPSLVRPEPDAAARERLAIVRRSSWRAHSRLRRGQPVVATRKKAKSSEAPPSSPGCPSPFFTVLFLDTNWGWQPEAIRRRSSSKRRCRGRSTSRSTPADRTVLPAGSPCHRTTTAA